jgi:tetratricopeptide (TPR) repeat protein
MRSSKLGFAALLAALLAFSCSSAPKTPPVIYEGRNQAAQFIQLGAKALRENSMASARTFYTEAYRLYTAYDEAEGRIRALDGLGRLPDASTSELWGTASRIADESGDKKLVALSALLNAELELWKGTEDGARAALTASLSGADLLSGLSKDRARALRLAGTAAKTLGDYPAALSHLDEAAGLDRKEKAFAEHASDRYLTASVYSKAGNYTAAKSALMEALASDRRAEHAAGIGGDYYALALVEEKFGDSAVAAGYFTRAAEVFRAARFEDRALEAEQRRDAIAGVRR